MKSKSESKPKSKKKRKQKDKDKDNFRVKQFFIPCSDPYFNLFVTYSHYSKNLYNATLYELRQHFFSSSELIPYNDLEKIMKKKMSNRSDKPGYDYYQMPHSQSAQQTIMKAHGSMDYFLRSLKKYNRDPRHYTGKPKIPKYKKKKFPYYIVTLTNQACTVKGNIVTFPKAFNSFALDISECLTGEEYDFIRLSEVRFYLKHNSIVIEVVYKVKAKKEYKLRKDRICGVDLGIVNFAACSFNFNKHPMIIDSFFIKGMNQLYNKKIAKYKSLAKKCNNLYNTKRIDALWTNRYRKIKDFMHKASSKLVQECLKHRVSKIVIGENKGWKQGKENMQNFASIPFTMFKKMVEYKAKLYGIKVIFVPEMYTSGTSFLDGEATTKANYDKTRRVKRGLFISNQGIAINDDVNAGYQMIKKYEKKENDSRRRRDKSLISCFNKKLNWKLIASTVERVFIIKVNTASNCKVKKSNSAGSLCTTREGAKEGSTRCKSGIMKIREKDFTKNFNMVINRVICKV